MKIALKYGLAVTLIVLAWIVIVRHLMGVGADSKANVIAPTLFNIAQILAIFLVMIRRKNDAGGELGFKQGMKTGVAISFVYAASACLVFLIDYLISCLKLHLA